MQSLSLEDELLIWKIFFPHAAAKLEAARKPPAARFVHYSSAESAMKVLTTKQVWMRSASVMNDFLEIEHGWHCLTRALESATGIRFKAALDAILPGMSSEMDAGFGQYRDRFRHQTFLTCLSEHGVPNDDHGKGDLDEDRYGRLSMWRAYGSPTGVAIVLNGEPFLTSQLAGGPIWTPVAYLDEISFPQKVDEVTNSIETHMPFLRSIERGTISLTVFNMLRWAVLATKHPGFFEEREWRAVFSPNHENASGLLHSIETIRGVPQPVWKIRLDSMPGFDLPALIERIIIGPTQDPIPIYEALVHTLREAGVSEPENKVTRSNIPLRR